MPAPYLQTKGLKPPEPEKICLFAQTSFRNQPRRFGIKLDDRRRHMYIIGKTGMGKSTMMENMMLHDIYAGNGVGLVDPHGDFAEKILDFIPPHRTNDIIYVNPSDLEHPIGFNILEIHNEEQKHLVAAGMMGTFKKIWPDVWSSRMEYILNNTLLALLDNPGTTLLGINRLMSDAKYRKKIVRNVKDPIVKAFWQVEFASYSERYAQEATSSVQNKIGQFLSTALIRNMVAQPKSTIDIRAAMDQRKILIMNLSKGRIGEDNSRLLGGMLITKIQLSAMERVDTPENERADFFLYVDEFQNFATPSFANILSEARKYHLGLIMAHQYVAQLDEVVADAVFGNVGTIVAFRVGAADAEALAKEFAPVFLEEDIVNLAKYQVLLKLMIDGVASQPFSALTLPPIGSPTGSTEKVVRVSRERYGKNRAAIEEKVNRWSGLDMDMGDDEDDDEPKQKQSSKKKDSSNRGQDKKSEKKQDRNEKSSRQNSDGNKGNGEKQKSEKKNSRPREEKEKKTDKSDQENDTAKKVDQVPKLVDDTSRQTTVDVEKKTQTKTHIVDDTDLQERQKHTTSIQEEHVVVQHSDPGRTDIVDEEVKPIRNDLIDLSAVFDTALQNSGSEKSSEQENTQENTTQDQASVESQEDKPKKKKRKRKRKKKKKTGESTQSQSS